MSAQPATATVYIKSRHDDGSLTPKPVENIYSGIVSIRHLRLLIFLGQLNNLELWGADIANTYLEGYTHETLFIIACPDFEELECFILIFNMAVYGLKSILEKGGLKGSMISSRVWDSCLASRSMYLDEGEQKFEVLGVLSPPMLMT